MKNNIFPRRLGLLGAFLGLFLSTNVSAQNESDQTSPAQSTGPTVLADTVVWGGPIYTADDTNPRVSAVGIKDGRFIFVGSRLGAEALIGPDTTVLSLEGSAAFPGFVDGHAHLSSIGEREVIFNLEGINSLTALQEALGENRAANPDARAIIGRGWIETHFPEQRMPSRWDLDTIVNDVPVILTRADGHALVANSKALELAAITSQTEAPFGGSIHKNALGEPTGIIIDTAMSLLTPVIPVTTQENLKNHLIIGATTYADLGWTGLHNMSAGWDESLLLEQLSDNGDVGLRVYNSVDIDQAEPLFTGGARQSANARIVTRAIKIYTDGALGSRGAALLDKYKDADTKGLMLITEADASASMQRALRSGIQINSHAIGDAGNRKLLNWMEQAFATVAETERAVSEPRWRIEHAQIINPADLPRFSALGVIPSMQPSHAIGDLHFAEKRLGRDRLKGAYAWNSLLNTGSIIIGGSDAPVERGDPMIEFYAAITRTDLNGYSDDTWHPEETVSRSDALKMFTIWPAYGAFMDTELGTITVGKKADLTAFDQDIMTIEANRILQTKAILTMVEGEILFLASSPELPEQGG